MIFAVNKLNNLYAYGTIKKSLPIKDPIDKIIEDLSNPNYTVRYEAAYKILELGPKAKRAVPELIKIVENKNEDFEVQYIAVYALLTIGKDAKIATPALVNLIKDNTVFIDIRCKAGEALAEMAPFSVPYLKKLLTSKDPDTVRITVHTIGQIGPQAKDTLSGLINILKTTR
ncbi:MAG: HEAT repeat domain-containing protein, partial [Armatimonadota bacterium]